jgi:hypothetical protein
MKTQTEIEMQATFAQEEILQTKRINVLPVIIAQQVLQCKLNVQQEVIPML